jgi:hypothetical protein
MDELLMKRLMKKHAQIGQTIEAAEKSNPFQAIFHAKKAAADSHQLLGEMLLCLSAISKAQ